MFDRLGRRDDETPFIVEWFVNNGIEVWSAEEGQQRFDNHVDMSFFMLFSICASYCTLSVQKKDLGKILFNCFLRGFVHAGRVAQCTPVSVTHQPPEYSG